MRGGKGCLDNNICLISFKEVMVNGWKKIIYRTLYYACRYSLQEKTKGTILKSVRAAREIRYSMSVPSPSVLSTLCLIKSISMMCVIEHYLLQHQKQVNSSDKLHSIKIKHQYSYSEEHEVEYYPKVTTQREIRAHPHPPRSLNTSSSSSLFMKAALALSSICTGWTCSEELLEVGIISYCDVVLQWVKCYVVLWWS